LPVCNPRGIQRPTNNVIPNARQVFHTAATDQDDGVFLQIVADTGDVGCYFNPIGQTHTCNFAKGRIRLLWRRRIYASTHASFLRTFLQSRTTRLVLRLLSTLTNQLIKRRHEPFSSSICAAFRAAKSSPVKPFYLSTERSESTRGTRPFSRFCVSRGSFPPVRWSTPPAEAVPLPRQSPRSTPAQA